MSNPIEFSDYCTSTLVAAANNFQTTLLIGPVTDSLPVMSGVDSYFYLTIVDAPSYNIDLNPPAQREIVKVTAYVANATGYSLTVVRGITTDAQVWSVGSYAEIRPCAQALYDLKDAGGGSFVQAQYLTLSGDTGLTSERVLTAGTNISFVDTGANGTLTINGTGSGAPIDATYVTMSLNGTLTNERVLTAGTNITLIDGGANSTVTISATGGSTKSEEFITNNTFNPPTGVTGVWLTLVGGGGGGKGSADGAASGQGGGSSAEIAQNLHVSVSGPVTITIGGGGAGGAINTNGADGGATSFGSYVALGGYGATLQQGALGGGVNGGLGGTSSITPGVGAIGGAEAPTYFGGGGGGGANTTAGSGKNGSAGAGSGGTITGGAGGIGSTNGGGGGGGAATIYGAGGAGGAANGAGQNATTGNYGAGGGGGGGNNGTGQIGGNGASGYVLVSWIG